MESNVFVSILDFIFEHPEKVGGSSAVGFGSIAFGAHKYLQKQLEKVYLKIKTEQESDAKEFKKLKGAVIKLKSKVDAHTEAFKIIERRLNVKKDKIAQQQTELVQMIADLQTQEAHFMEHAHKLELTERDVRLLQGLFKDCITDVKDIATRSSSLELSFAKVLGALSGKIE